MTYYALSDLQNGGSLMATGLNDQSPEDLATSLLSYYSADSPASDDPQDVEDWEAMQSWTAERLANLGEFAILSQSEPFPEVD